MMHRAVHMVMVILICLSCSCISLVVIPKEDVVITGPDDIKGRDTYIKMLKRVISALAIVEVVSDGKDVKSNTTATTIPIRKWYEWWRK